MAANEGCWATRRSIGTDPPGAVPISRQAAVVDVRRRARNPVRGDHPDHDLRGSRGLWRHLEREMDP